MRTSKSAPTNQARGFHFIGVCLHALERRERRSEETNMRDAGRAKEWVREWVWVKGAEGEDTEGEKRSGGRGRTWRRMRREEEGGRGWEWVRVVVRMRKKSTRLYKSDDDRAA